MMMERNSYIGGADAASILGYNEYQSVMKCWRKKVGLESDDFDNKHIRRGNAMESLIETYCRETFDPEINSAEMFERFGTPFAQNNLKNWYKEAPSYTDGKLGFVSLPDRPQISVRHPKFDFCGGHPDGLTKKTVWEFKAPAMRNFSELERSGVSKTWLIQVQYYMWITQIPEGRIAVWNYDQWEPMIVRLKPNRKLFRIFEEMMPAFWFHVETKTEPNFEGMPEIESLVETEFLDVILSQYVDTTEQKFDSTDDQKMMKATIMSHIDGIEQAETAHYYISAKQQTRFGTTFARLIVKPKETPESQAWLKKLKREQAIETINHLTKEYDLPELKHETSKS